MRLLLLVALAGCAGAEAAAIAPTVAASPPIDGAVGLVPGESMSYQITLGGVLAGEAAIAVGDAGTWQGHRAVVVKSRAATAGAVDLVKHVVDEATTWVDLDTGRPLRLETYVELDGKPNTATATFTDHRADIITRRDTDKPHTTRVSYLDGIVFDTHSAMAQVRGWRAAKGTTRSVFVVGGKRLWRVEVTYVGDEVIGSGVGNRHAIRLDGASSTRHARRAWPPRRRRRARSRCG